MERTRWWGLLRLSPWWKYLSLALKKLPVGGYVVSSGTQKVLNWLQKFGHFCFILPVFFQPLLPLVVSHWVLLLKLDHTSHGHPQPPLYTAEWLPLRSPILAALKNEMTLASAVAYGLARPSTPASPPATRCGRAAHAECHSAVPCAAFPPRCCICPSAGAHHACGGSW